MCREGRWDYRPRVEWELLIMLPDGRECVIEWLGVDETKKMLGGHAQGETIKCTSERWC